VTSPDPGRIRDSLWALIHPGIFNAADLERLSAWVLAHRHALVSSPDRPEDEKRGWVGGSTDPEDDGPRCFIRRWQPDEFIGRHTHPNGMCIILLQGRLEIGEGSNNRETVPVILKPGDRLVRVSDESGFDHFPHTMQAAPEATISLHLYSHSPSRGRSVEC